MEQQRKLTTEELDSIKKLATELSETSAKFGQLKIERINFQSQLNALDEYEVNLEKEYLSLKEKEFNLTKELTDKYGDGTINLETGIIS